MCRGQGYNLGNHRLPSNKFLMYEHAVRIPMVMRGPGIPAGAKSAVLGTNVDYAPTFLAMAGIRTPACMDGRSILSQLVPPSLDDALPSPTRTHMAYERAALEERPWARKEQFHQYYNQGGPSPFDGKPQGAWADQGWSPSGAHPGRLRGVHVERVVIEQQHLAGLHALAVLLPQLPHHREKVLDLHLPGHIVPARGQRRKRRHHPAIVVPSQHDLRRGGGAKG